MGQAGWRGRVGPPSFVVVAAIVLAALGPAAIAAAPPAGQPPLPAECRATDRGTVAQAAGRTLSAQVSSRLVLDSNGAVAGRRLRVAAASGRLLDLSLPAESFVAEPVGDVVVYGFHDAKHGSTVRAVVGASGCETLLARPTEVVRRAVLDATGNQLYVHSVSRQGRRDLGVSRHELATGESSRAVEPLPPDDAFGPTFATNLRWSIDGAALAVQSCGGTRCRTRVLDVATGGLQTYAGEGHGDLIGLTARALLAFDACDWAPCPLLSIDRETGEPRELSGEALSASLTVRDGRPVADVQTPAGYVEVWP